MWWYLRMAGQRVVSVDAHPAVGVHGGVHDPVTRASGPGGRRLSA
jgi:hypothetical protein